MFEILIFGDSLTRGSDPGTGRRHAFADRWPSVLQAGLGPDAHVIAEGLGGRTTCHDDFEDGIDRNGARVLPTLLASHVPLDLVIIMLGSNDLKPAISGRADDVAVGIETLLAIIARSGIATQSLIVSPPHFVASPNHGNQPRAGRSVAESQRLAGLLEATARQHGAEFFDASTVAQASPIDGVHLDRDNTRRLGEALVPVVKAMIGRSAG